MRIGELAALAGTTTRAIRHYHSIGLLTEPERDDSGYRRYGAIDLVRVIRIRRLRALEMPLEQIAAQLTGSIDADADVAGALRALAHDIARRITELRALHTRVLDLAASNTFGDSAETWSTALRERGLLDHRAELPDRERPAVDLLDALHPGGIAGVVEQASGLMSDRERLDQLRPLLLRFSELPEDEALAEAIANVVPRPEGAAPPVDPNAMEALIGDRLRPRNVTACAASGSGSSPAHPSHAIETCQHERGSWQPVLRHHGDD